MWSFPISNWNHLIATSTTNYEHPFNIIYADIWGLKQYGHKYFPNVKLVTTQNADITIKQINLVEGCFNLEVLNYYL